MKTTRRDFLRCGGAFGFGTMASRLGLAGLAGLAADATAQAASDYKALVCVFLYGGVDGNNVLVPYDTAGYARYSAVRTAGSNVQLTQASLLPIQPAGSSVPFGLHPDMGELQTLFGQRKLAIVANVGPLTEPTTRQNYQIARPEDRKSTRLNSSH